MCLFLVISHLNVVIFVFIVHLLSELCDFQTITINTYTSTLTQGPSDLLGPWTCALLAHSVHTQHKKWLNLFCKNDATEGVSKGKYYIFLYSSSNI